MPGNLYKDVKTGKTVTLFGDSALKAVAQGLVEPLDKEAGVEYRTPAGNTAVAHDSGELANMAGRELVSGGISPEEQGAQSAAAWETATHNSAEDTIRAFGQGVLSIPTLGLSDFAFDDAAIQARQHPWARAGGEIAATLPFAFAPGGGISGALGGGLKGMAAEGALFGFGQGVSNLALSNEPLTAESAFSELVTSTAGGGLLGLGGGLVGKGLSKVSSKLEKFSAKALGGSELEKVANTTLNMSSEEATHWTRALERASGQTDDFVKGAEKAESTLAKAGKKARQLPVGHFTGADVANHWRFSQGLAEDAAQFRAVPKIQRELNSIRKEMAELGGPLDALGREKLSSVGEVAWANEALKTQRPKVAQLLDRYRQAAVRYAEESGIGVGEKFLPAVTHDIETVQAYLKNPAISEAVSTAPRATGEAAAPLLSAQKAYRKAWGLGASDTLTAESLSRFSTKELPVALKQLESLSAYQKALETAGAGKQVAEVKEAISALGKDNEAWANIDPGELLVKAGFKDPEAILQIAKDQPDLLKFWLANDAVTASRAAKAASSFSGGGFKGYIARKTGGALGASLMGHWGWPAGEAAVGLAMNGRALAQATGKTTARIASALDKLAKGVSKPAVQRSALEILNLMNPEDPGKNLHDAYRKRAEEFARLASNPETQENLAQSMRDSGVTGASLGVADKAIVHADNAIKYLNAQAPKDGGEIQTLGRSRWRATEADINKWTNMARAVMDPVSVVEGVASGTVSPAAVHALKETAPATFEEIQRQFIRRLPEIQKNATYDQQIRMGILFEVPANSVQRPEFVNFIQQSWANKPQPMKIDASAKPEPQTKGQQLLSF